MAGHLLGRLYKGGEDMLEDSVKDKDPGWHSDSVSQGVILELTIHANLTSDKCDIKYKQLHQKVTFFAYTNENFTSVSNFLPRTSSSEPHTELSIY